MFQPEKIDHPHGLQITYQENNRTRSLYVYHESAQVGLHHDRYRAAMALTKLSFSSSTVGNSDVVQRHSRGALRIPEDGISNGNQ